MPADEAIFGADVVYLRYGTIRATREAQRA